jgi:hypothetical protein
MKLMPTRYLHLLSSFAGYQQTGMSLIKYEHNQLFPTTNADDLGIYIIIPKLAHFFNLSLETAIDFFFFSILILPALISIFGFFKLYSSATKRMIALIGITILMFFAYYVGDVYLAYYAGAVIVVPWMLYFIKKRRFSLWQAFSFLFFGIAIGLLHYIRAYSGVASLLFIGTLTLFNFSLQLRQKSFLLINLLIGLSIPTVYFSRIYDQSKKYAEKNFPQNQIGLKNHVLWHNIYIGFGFLNVKNPDPAYLKYGDQFSVQKVRSIKPEVTNNSEEYERILKNEVLRLIKEHPVFALYTLFAKIGVLLLYLLIFCNFGLIATLLYPKPWQQELAFWLAIAFNSIFPLLTIPISEYALGFASFAMLYGIVSINYALNLKQITS